MTNKIFSNIITVALVVSASVNAKEIVSLDTSGLHGISNMNDAAIRPARRYKISPLQSIQKAEAGRIAGRGIAGGYFMCVNIIDFEPVYQLLTIGYADGFTISNGNRYQAMMMKSGGGYIGVGNGLRIGGYGQSGQKSITSTNNIDNNHIRLMTEVSFGVFMIEKTMVKNRFNITVGGGMGRGRIEVSNSHISNDESDSEKLTARFLSLESHGVFTYTAVPGFFHLGIGASLPVFISNEGFQRFTDSFSTFNPGMQFRLIFGNLG